MIHVWVKRDKTKQIVEITMDGHADFSERGSDIVCAAVSGISIGLLNSIEKFLDVRFPMDEEEEGFMWIQVPNHLDSDRAEKLQLLLNSMVFSIEMIANEYSQYVRIIEEQAE